MKMFGLTISFLYFRPKFTLKYTLLSSSCVSSAEKRICLRHKSWDAIHFVLMQFVTLLNKIRFLLKLRFIQVVGLKDFFAIHKLMHCSFGPCSAEHSRSEISMRHANVIIGGYLEWCDARRRPPFRSSNSSSSCRKIADTERRD